MKKPHITVRKNRRPAKKKRMEKLTNVQKKFLKGKAHPLEPVVMVGKNGVTQDLIKLTKDSLAAHELIKVRFVEFKEEKKRLALEIEEKTNSIMVGIIGHVAILYRQNPNQEKRRIKLPHTT
jgi:RNA-binding protein